MSTLFLLRLRRRLAASAMAPIVAAFLLAPVFRASAQQLDFDDAVAQAVKAAPSLEARLAGVTAAREEAVQAAALPDPELIVGIDSLPVTGPDSLEFAASEMTMKKIGVMQAFPARAKREARQSVADTLVARAQTLSTIEELLVREQAATAWLAVWTARRELSLLQELRGQADLAVELAEARLRGGSGAALDAMAAKAAALDVENRIDAAEAALAVTRARLARWLAIDVESLPEVGQPPDFETLPVAEAVLLSTAAQQRALIDWRSQEAVADARLAEALADKWPDWSVAATYGQRDRGRDDLLMFEVRVGLPLFARNRQDRLIAARRADLQAAAAERRDAERAQLEAVRSALAEWHGLRAQIERHHMQILPLAADRSKAAIAGYGGGGPLQPWLDARREEIAAQIAHIRHLGELGRVWTSLAYLLHNRETAR